MPASSTPAGPEARAGSSPLQTPPANRPRTEGPPGGTATPSRSGSAATAPRSPAPQPAAARAPVGPSRPAPVDPAVADWRDGGADSGDLGDLGDEFDDDLLDDVPARWVNMATILGASLVFVVALQALLALIEGFTYNAGEPIAEIATDLLHRLGFPFASPLATVALLFLVVGLVLLSLPAYFEESTSPSQDRLSRLAVGMAAAVAVILALGSLLAVRANFHTYSERGTSVPGYVVVQYIGFLVGNLGTAVAAVYAAMQVMGLRDRRP